MLRCCAIWAKKAYAERYDPRANGSSCLENTDFKEDLKAEAFSDWSESSGTRIFAICLSPICGASGFLRLWKRRGEWILSTCGWVFESRLIEDSPWSVQNAILERLESTWYATADDAILYASKIVQDSAPCLWDLLTSGKPSHIALIRLGDMWESRKPSCSHGYAIAHIESAASAVGFRQTGQIVFFAILTWCSMGMQPRKKLPSLSLNPTLPSRRISWCSRLCRRCDMRQLTKSAW